MLLNDDNSNSKKERSYISYMTTGAQLPTEELKNNNLILCKNVISINQMQTKTIIIHVQYFIHHDPIKNI